MRDIKQIDFNSEIEHAKWISNNRNTGYKEVGSYWGDDGRIYVSYIELF